MLRRAQNERPDLARPTILAIPSQSSLLAMPVLRLVPVFVYGTLRRGFRNHALLDSSESLGSGRTRERYALYVSRIPFLAREPAHTRVAGEVYLVTPTILAALDRLEGHPDWYRREQIEVELDDATTRRCWTYFNPRPAGVLSATGDYANAVEGDAENQQSGG